MHLSNNGELEIVINIHSADLTSFGAHSLQQCQGLKKGSSCTPLFASGTKDSHVFGVFRFLQTPLHMSHRRVFAALGTRLAGLPCIVAGRSFKKTCPPLRGELCPAQPQSFGLDRLVADAATEVQPQVLPLCCARIRYGNRSLGEPRSRAKSARPTPIVAFSPQHHKLYQATLSVQGLRKDEKISCPISVQLGSLRNLENGFGERRWRAAENASPAAACKASTVLWQRCMGLGRMHFV